MTGFLRRQWVEMTTQDFQRTDMAQAIAILPVAAIEQHGPHLPVEVDTAINRGVLARAMELAPTDLPVTVLPAMPVGKSNEHIAYPGTLTLSAETLIRLWTEIGESVARAGVRKLVLFNSHGGQPQISDIVARELRVRCRMLAVTCNVYALGKPAGLFPASELKHGIHGGSVETSIMMHLCPELVRREELADFRPSSLDMEGEYEILTPEGSIGFGWETQDLSVPGACGNALDADAERGRQLVEHYAARFVALLKEIHRYPLSALRAGPLERQ
ncbi:MAG: creatininase family protein [Alphaproteobacteria bacterium]|nr:creatininase family protein [Alphaproteobacteria bacterium]